jgi:ribosomal protein L24E
VACVSSKLGRLILHGFNPSMASWTLVSNKIHRSALSDGPAAFGVG